MGQATEGSILGSVLDRSGAALVGVKVTVTNINTQFPRSTLTNETGEYVITNVPLGSYTVTAEMKGFKRSVHPPVDMTVKARVRVDLQMELGELSQSVEVTGAAELLKTDTIEVSTVVQREQLAALPSLNRNFLSMQVLTPGTLRHWPNGGGDRIGDFSGGESMQVNGLDAGQNNFIIDGVSNNVELTGGMNAVPSIDAIEEFSIQTNAFSAEFGRAGGSVVNVGLRSGTNDLHGFGYDYIQNDIFNARPYDFTGTNPAKPALRRNLFGGGVGGPIIRNRVFLFANYEGLRQPQTVIEYDTVPTALERKGDFSQSGWVVYDPATTTSAGTRTPFANNVIPTDRINPLMAKLVSIFPQPNYKDTNPTVLKNYLAFDRNVDSKDTMNFKGDVNLSPSDTMTMRFSRQWYSKLRSGFIPGNWMGGQGLLNGTNAGWTETHVFSPSLVNEVRAGWNYINDGNNPGNNNVIEELNSIPGGRVTPGYPTVSMRNITSTKAVRPLTTLPNPYFVWQNSLQFMDNLSWHHGKHAIKAGVDYTHHRNDVGGSGATGGVKFSIDGYQTVAKVGGTRPSNLTGTADALLGLANGLTTYEYLDKTRMRETRFAAFVTDDWRPTRKLSVSLGLRYEYSPNWNMKGDQVTNFDLATGKILVPNTTKNWVQDVIGLPGGVLPPGYAYVSPDSVYPHNDHVDLAPRVGFAYSITNRIVLRGNYGIFYAPPSALSMNNTNGSPFSFQVQLTGDTASPIHIADGFPTSGIYDTLNSNAIAPTQYQTHFNTPVVEKYGMNLQVMPFKKTVVEIGYEGNHAYRLDDSWRLNFPTPAPGDIDARRPYPQWGEGFGVMFRGYSHFNALEITVRQQPVKGLAIYSAFTMEHSYGAGSSPDPYNFDYGYGMLASDYGLQWATSAIYDLPALRDQPRWLRHAAGGWQASSIIQLRGGLPFSVASSQTMNDDIDASRANLVLTNGPANLPSGQRTINNWFNTAAFTTPADYTYGNSGLNILRGPGFAEVDFALQKTFTFHERYKATFRAEAENLLNRVNLGMPASTLGASGLGTIRSLGGDPRFMQMVLRFAF